MSDHLEDALNLMSQQGWRITLHPEKLPLFEGSFLLVARHPKSLELKFDLQSLAFAKNENERQAIIAALANGNDKKAAAKRLGISISTLYKKLDKHGIGFAQRNVGNGKVKQIGHST